MTDSSTTKWTVGSDAFSKMGLRYDDHHMKDDRGKYTTSPPAKLKTLYHQGPPAKVYLRGEINSLKQQGHCLGVYKLLQSVTPNGLPAWKHVNEDLIIASGHVDGEEGWVVAQFTTFNTKQRRCMVITGEDMPFEPKREPQAWKEWDGRAWSVSTVKCRASPHGWGEAGVEKQAEDDVYLDRHGGSPTRARKSPPSSPTPLVQ